MSVAELLLIVGSWKNIMSVKQLEMVPCDLALGVGISLADTIREIFVQHVKKILTWKTKVNYLGC
jgi:cobalamin biosynthesis Co2+ chelatase CbiK